MNRKTFRCGVLALLLTAAFALPAIAATSTKRGSRPPQPRQLAAEQGLVERAWGIVTGFLGGAGGLHSLNGANRGGIDPNGTPAADPRVNPLLGTAGDPGDNRGGIDPNG